MGVHIINEEVTICWVLEPNPSLPGQYDYDVIVTAPDGQTTYIERGLTTYEGPTASAQGSATYTFMPTQKGKWDVRLAIGNNQAFSHKTLRTIYIVQPRFNTIRTIRSMGLNL